ncbi:M56 family metallopeptidase [Butyrivibrio sp. AE3004]|uniref:M56 family metallopeptidase n=1 Tax=Butyrivibrio sp. AE3004 TaxID=1506994 RepID=UPI000494B3E2|nr:M56 family metallopeptidase [Butyrivibrio sp. AE3004]
MTTINIFVDFFTGILASSLCIFIIYFLRKNFFKIGVLSLSGLVFIYGLCTFRALVPLEFPFAVPVKFQLLMPITDILFSKSIQIYGAVFWGWQIASFIYFIIVLLFITRLIIYYGKANKAIQRTQRITNKNTTALLSKIISEGNHPIHPRLLASHCIDSPISIGIFKPAIILPLNYQNIYEDIELYYILKHEYIHILNRDSLKKLLINIASCLLFWNPCIYLLKKDFIHSIELRCDKAVLSNMSSKAREDYLTTLLTVLKNKNSEHICITSCEPALNFVSNESIYIKERFETIKDYSDTHFQKAIIFIPILVTSIVFCSYIFILQPNYNPPIEDIIEDSDCYEIDMTTDYIAVSESGNATIFLKDGTTISATDDDIEWFIKYGGKVIYK